jgi:DNA polymerase IV
VQHDDLRQSGKGASAAPSRARVIAHFDVDAFYASVAIRDDPSLRGKPVAIAGSSRRAVVLTASYEARPFGVRSAMPLYKARSACPELVVVRPDMNRYRAVSRQIFEILGRSDRKVEALSLDEAFVDLGAVSIEEAASAAAAVRKAIFLTTQLTVSAGVGTGKMVAKIASDVCKPDGLLAITPGMEADFLAPLPVGRLSGIGPKTQSRLSGFGIATIGDLAQLDRTRLRELFGSWGNELAELARGVDRRPVETERETKSISTEETFEFDVTDYERLVAILRDHARELAAALAREGLSARTVGIKVKRSDRSILGRQTHLAEPTREARRIFRAAVYCLRRAALDGAPVRLLGTRVASLVAGEPLQPSLF